MRDKPNVAIIGCGRMGQRRAKAIGDSARLSILCDSDAGPIHEARRSGIKCPRGLLEWQDAINDDIDIVIVCTPHNMLAEIGTEAVRAGKHVLIEKPGAIRAAELACVAKLAKEQGVKVRVGYNLRYHPAIREAKALVTEGKIGDLMYIRGVYGHGGRLGMEKEWRCDPKISGGGELIDQGVHLIDLSRWFLGDTTDVMHGPSNPLFWNTSVEDNVFMLLFHEGIGVSQLHASWTEWRNTFRFEIFGTRGKIEINGLGGSYGPETLIVDRMTPEMGRPVRHITEYPTDDSFEVEWREFLADIREDREPEPGIADAQAVLKIVEEVYGGN